MNAKLSKTKQNKALQIIAKWLGPQMGTIRPCGKCGTCQTEYGPFCENPTFLPAPTGPDAAYKGEGPMLNPEWDWPASGPTPTILLEGGPYDWAVYASLDPKVVDQMTEIGVFCESYSGYALCLYPA